VNACLVPGQYRTLRSFAFGDSPALADDLLDLVLKGVKTATCSTEDEPNISKPGERWIVRDGRGRARCVIESTEVTFRRYDEVDATFARDEGEGDRSLVYWRDAHRRYFTRLGKFSEHMMLMCERFRLVEVFEHAPEATDTVTAERAPALTLPGKRERGQTQRAAATSDHLTRCGDRKDTIHPSARSVVPPLPLAGEGWGGGAAASEVSMADEKKPTWKVSSRTRSNARALRKDSTDAERLLWAALRDHRLNGAGFRRQVPIEKYIADFVCHAARLVIELDGGQHFSDQAERADAARSAVIEARGFRVLRFSNHDVTTNRAGVLETIATVIAERAPTLALPRKREREQGKQSS